MKMLDNQIKEKNFLVIGDIILDCYYIGSVNRVSPEAPVPVFLENDKRISLGGAANVANNMAASGQKVSILSIIGEDDEGIKLKELLELNKIDCSQVIIDSERPTTTKKRYFCENNQQIFRHDIESVEDINDDLQYKLLSRIESIIKEYDLIVVSDYGKGVCTEHILQGLIEICNSHSKKIIADVKGTNALKYKGFFLIKPNIQELRELIGKRIASMYEVVDAAQEFCKLCQVNYVVTTCGQNGMIVVDKKREVIKVESNAKNILDVTGAGDTVMAFLAIGIANGLKVKDIVHLSNFAAAIQVSRIGTSTVSIYEVIRAMAKERKIIEVNDLIKLLKSRGEKKVVFTNGCFDIIHAGHVKNLKKASEYGDILVVGVNSDKSVRRLKGEMRPINTLEDRMCVLASIEYVDFVVSFEENTPLEVILKLKPDILVKGFDYKKKDVIGNDIVESYGGKVELIPLYEGISTSSIIDKLKKYY